VRKASALVQNAAVTPMRYISPLDPECPVVAEFMETLFGDPTTMAMGAPVEDITEEFDVGTASSVSGVRNMASADV
jgi:hypothetical protein